MKKTLAVLALASALFTSAAAQANPIHSVWSKSAPEMFAAPGYGWITPVNGDATLAWDESNVSGFASAKIETYPGKFFEFKLVKVTASTTHESIIGDWDVFENGSLVCSSCAGEAYGLDNPLGDYFKIYITTTPDYYFYAGFITDVYDF